VKRHFVQKQLGVGLLLLVFGLAGFLFAWLQQEAPQERNITITAHKYAYQPSVLTVNRGDRVHIRFLAQDVTHGFYVEGYNLDAKARPQNPTFWLRRPSGAEDYEEVDEISFVADHAGKFRYRCSITCGYMHPFMQGELIVKPNYLYSTSLGLLLALAVGMLWTLRPAPAGEKP
jgi:heme/copper-type cytochrome/quinol oxidase subunit 2